MECRVVVEALELVQVVEAQREVMSKLHLQESEAHHRTRALDQFGEAPIQVEAEIVAVQPARAAALSVRVLAVPVPRAEMEAVPLFAIRKREKKGRYPFPTAESKPYVISSSRR